MEAIYQRARPITFDQVVGQEHVKETLQAALSRGRIGHAYLFSGPRGVGKTTTARLLAMAVNCQNKGVRPCGECESCRLVRRGNHPDVTELDAASNNSVEDIRDLREKVRLAAIRGGKRVWVLDEAHMLSKSASNALLKTLEEPPSNLVFVLATTEPERLPPTILSRTQHFRFRRHTEAEIAGKLARLCQEEGVAADAQALKLIARAADGAMRDAESLLERLLTAGEPITLKAAETALGLPPQSRIRALAAHLAERDLSAMFHEAGTLYADGFAPRSLAERLKLSLRDALYTRVGLEGDFQLDLQEDDLLRVIHALDDESERFVRFDDLFSLEVALIKAVNALAHNAPREVGVWDQGAGDEKSSPQLPAPSSPFTLPDFNPTGRQAPVRTPPNPPAPSHAQAASQPTPAEAPARELRWRDVTVKASVQLRAFLNDARATVEGRRVHLKFTHDFHYKRTLASQDELAQLVSETGGDGYQLELEGPKGEITKKS